MNYVTSYYKYDVGTEANCGHVDVGSAIIGFGLLH